MCVRGGGHRPLSLLHLSRPFNVRSCLALLVKCRRRNLPKVLHVRITSGIRRMWRVALNLNDYREWGGATVFLLPPGVICLHGRERNLISTNSQNQGLVLSFLR